MKTFLAAALLLIAANVWAQQPQYSLATLLKKIPDNYPLLKAKQARVNAAAYYMKGAKKDYLPDVIVANQYQYGTDNGLEGSYYSNEGTSMSTSGGIRSQNIYQPVFGSFTTLMIDWHAFDFGKVKESVNLAESKLDFARSDYANAVFQQQMKVTDAYLLFILSEKLVSVQENNLNRSKSFQQYVVSHTRSGLLPGIDSSSANAEVAKAELALLQSRQYVEEQKNNLEQLSGVAADSIRVDTAVLLQNIPAYQLTMLSVDNNPLLQYQQKALTTQYNQLKVLRKSVLPTINILGVNWARGSGIDRVTKTYNTSIGQGLGYQTYNYMAAVAVKWNITSLAKNKQQVLGAAQEIEATHNEIEEQAAMLNRQIKNANLQYQSALQQTKVAPVEYKAALDAYNLSNARYQAGLTSLNEVIQAYYVLNRADVDRAIAVNNVWRALLQHAAASGNLSEITTQIPQ